MSRSNGANTSDALVSIYKSDNSSDTRRIVNSLFISGTPKRSSSSRDRERLGI